MKVTIISADINSGKTTYVQKLIDEDRSEYLGFLSLSNEGKNSFYLKDIKSNRKIHLMDDTGDSNLERIGRFYLQPNAFNVAKELLLNQVKEYGYNKTVVIDEVGRLELAGKGFNELLRELIDFDVNLVLCIRKSFVCDVIRFYNLDSFDLTVIEVPFIN
jgi:nucleoside-triphosphatase THEP1